MTTNKVIERVNAVKSNIYADEDKAKWISQLDGIISMQILNNDTPTSYSYPDDGDEELLVSEPFDNIYSLYLFSMIDFNNRDFGAYNNSGAMFNEAFDMYAKYYRRNNLPLVNNSITNIDTAGEEEADIIGG